MGTLLGVTTGDAKRDDLQAKPLNDFMVLLNGALTGAQFGGPYGAIAGVLIAGAGLMYKAYEPAAESQKAVENAVAQSVQRQEQLAQRDKAAAPAEYQKLLGDERYRSAQRMSYVYLLANANRLFAYSQAIAEMNPAERLLNSNVSAEEARKNMDLWQARAQRYVAALGLIRQADIAAARALREQASTPAAPSPLLSPADQRQIDKMAAGWGTMSPAARAEAARKMLKMLPAKDRQVIQAYLAATNKLQKP
jgi:hypothetical protein